MTSLLARRWSSPGLNPSGSGSSREVPDRSRLPVHVGGGFGLPLYADCTTKDVVATLLRLLGTVLRTTKAHIFIKKYKKEKE